MDSKVASIKRDIHLIVNEVFDHPLITISDMEHLSQSIAILLRDALDIAIFTSNPEEEQLTVQEFLKESE